MMEEPEYAERHRSLSIGLNAHLFSRQSNYRNAGISQYIYGLLRHLPLADARPKYSVYTSERGGTLTGVRRVVTRLNTQRPPLRILWEQLLLPYVARRDSLDMVHGLAYALPLVSPVPGIVTIYDLTFYRMPEAFPAYNRYYLRLVTRLSARRAEHVCTISESTRRDIVRTLGVRGSRVSVIYPGIADRFERPAPAEIASFRRERGLPERFVLYLGTLEPRKNVISLLRAYARLLHAGDDVPPLIVAGGKGWYFDNIFSEVEELGIAQRVYFPGYVPAAEQPYWYAAADLFVYPSYYEGFGLPVAEAMACGTPVVSSSAASLPEIVGDAGHMVPPDDVDALADAMSRLLASAELRATLGAAGRKRVKRFSWREAARRQVAVYNRVAQRVEGEQ